VRDAGLIPVAFQPRRAVEALTITHQEPDARIETLWEVAVRVD
jgi:hypothetical protein